MSTSNKRILLVDDEQSVTDMVRVNLGRAGYQHVECLNNPFIVEDKVAEFRPDLILLDINMPARDGLEVLEQLASHIVNGSLFVAMLTSAEDESIKHKALIRGASDFIAKPIEALELTGRVESVLLGKPNKNFILGSLMHKQKKDYP